MIDSETAKNLELVGNMTKKRSSHSLFGHVECYSFSHADFDLVHSTLNYTYTAMASRLLRVNLLAPITGPVLHPHFATIWPWGTFNSSIFHRCSIRCSGRYTDELLKIHTTLNIFACRTCPNRRHVPGGQRRSPCPKQNWHGQTHSFCNIFSFAKLRFCS